MFSGDITKTDDVNEYKRHKTIQEYIYVHYIYSDYVISVSNNALILLLTYWDERWINEYYNY